MSAQINSICLQEFLLPPQAAETSSDVTVIVCQKDTDPGIQFNVLWNRRLWNRYRMLIASARLRDHMTPVVQDLHTDCLFNSGSSSNWQPGCIIWRLVNRTMAWPNAAIFYQTPVRMLWGRQTRGCSRCHELTQPCVIDAVRWLDTDSGTFFCFV